MVFLNPKMCYFYILFLEITSLVLFSKAQHKENGSFAALKQVEIKSEDELEDFVVELDILADCKHKNVVGMYEAYYFGGKLWVRQFYLL